jgi:glycosyltransferase involved in cell wall biosynthesis
MYDEIFAAIRRLQLEGAVVHTGYLDRRDAVVLLRGSRACVYPSLYEGFGLPVLEAMAARTPVLTSNVSSLPEIAGDTALLVDPESTDAIEAGLTDLIQHREAALRRADAGYERAKRFTWEKSAESLGRVYRSLAEEGAP